MAQDALAAQVEIARLKFQLARYQRAEFGRSSEKLAREAEQLELAIEAWKRTRPSGSPPPCRLWRRDRERGRSAKAGPSAVAGPPPARRRVASRPVHLPLLRRHAAPDRRGHHRDPRLRARLLQSDPAYPRETVVPGLRHRGGGAGTRSRDCPWPRRCRAVGPYRRLKYDDHLPLYRQAEIFAREGVRLETSTLSGWVGATPRPCSRSSTRWPARSWRRTPCMSTTRRCRCWRREPARPGPGEYGRMFVTSGPSPASAHRRRCSSIRRTARGSIRAIT